MNEYTKARVERTGRLWRRFLAATGFPDDPRLSVQGKRAIMQEAITAGLSPELLVRTGLEAADLGVSADEFVPAESSPTDALPGTLAKVVVLVERAAAGCELFAAGDGPSRHLAAWEDRPGR